MATAEIVKDIRTIRYIPRPGEHQLSINLGLAGDASIVFEFAQAMGLSFEIVQIPTRSGIEIHALLLSEQIDSFSFEGELSNKLDQLTDQINPDAIRHVYGRTKQI